MKIFEVVYDNGEQFEDNMVRSFYYESERDALDMYDTINKDNYEFRWSGVEATATINLLELGTQVRTKLFEKHVIGDDEYKRIKAQEEADRASRRETLANGATLGDIDALAYLRDRMRGVA